MRKVWLFALTGVMAAGILGACNNASSINESDGTGFVDPGTAGNITNDYPYIISDSGLFIRRDGSLSSADVEEFSAEYYDAEEFEQDYVVPAVKAYNEKQGLAFARASETEEKLPVALNSIKTDAGNLTMQLDYMNAAEYLAFNKEINTYYDNWDTFVICPYADLVDYGISMDASFIDTDGNAVDLNTVKTTTGLYACVMNFGGSLPTGFSGKLQFEGAVEYTTADIYIQSDNAVRVYDSENLQYILFR
jgi:hypothetical protein